MQMKAKGWGDLMNRRRFLHKTSIGVASVSAFSQVTAGPKGRDISALAEADYTAQIELLGSGQTSAKELMQDALRRTQKVNDQINAVVHVAEDAMENLQDSGPLRGIPYLIKDLSDVKGMPTTFGSRAFLENVAAEDTPIVASLKANGANVFGKTNTPEFGLIGTTEPLALGACRNPWNTDHSSGGSSGGAAAAVAAGIVPAAQASDGGGSIRIPASCCGLVGLKPSRGRMAGEGDNVSLADIAVRHAVSRSVRDQALLLFLTQSQGGKAGLDPVGMVTDPINRPLKIAFSTKSARGNEPDADVKSALEQVAALCSELGHEVVEIAPDFDGEQFEAQFIDLWSQGAYQVKNMVAGRGVSESSLTDLLEPWTLYLAEHAARIGQESVPAVLSHFGMVKETVNQFMSDFDIWLTPTLAKAPVAIGNQAPNVPVETLMQRTFDYVAYSPLANAIGTPAISVPLSWNSAGLPIGSMFMAKEGQDELLLQLAYQLEEAQPWRDKRAPIWAG